MCSCALRPYLIFSLKSTSFIYLNRSIYLTASTSSRLRDIGRLPRRIGDRVHDDEVSRLMGDIDQRISDLTIEPGKVIHDRIRVSPRASQSFEQRITGLPEFNVM